MPATEYLRSAVGNHVLTNTPMTSPNDLYLALFTSEPNLQGNGDEVVGGSYARVSVDFIETVTPGEFENTSASISGMPTATVVGIGVYNSFTGGNLLYYEVFSPVSVNDGDTYPINAGVFIIRHQ